MREAIERVIADLGDMRSNNTVDTWDKGWNVALKTVDEKLKAVLAEHGENDSSRIPGADQSVQAT